LKSHTIHLYADEAGNFDFSGKGSKYFIMCCVVMKRPFVHIKELLNFKYDCNETGYSHRQSTNYQRFHAAEDLQYVRDEVFSVIQNHLQDFSIFAVILPKESLIDCTPKDEVAFSLYHQGFTQLLKAVLESENSEQLEKLVIVTDSIPTKKKQGVIRGALKEHLKKWSEQSGVPYQLYHHESESDTNLQIVDYVCWAIQRKWERDDDRSYSLIDKAIKCEKLYSVGAKGD
jgi:hypothetical protein